MTDNSTGQSQSHHPPVVSQQPQHESSITSSRTLPTRLDEIGVGLDMEDANTASLFGTNSTDHDGSLMLDVDPSSGLATKPQRDKSLDARLKSSPRSGESTTEQALSADNCPVGLDAKLRKRKLSDGRGTAQRGRTSPKAPAPLIVLPNEGPMGTCSWTGSHTEDRLSQEVLRTGLSAKRHVKEEKEESATAKHCILPCLKNGIDDLSSFFTATLRDRRQRCKTSLTGCHGRITSRVTLTNQRRQAWLTSFADASRPLRKQDRQVPHGLRGRALLDQCVKKKIPLRRAMWMARSAGAQELASVQRSRHDTTITRQLQDTWIKDWTLCVENFVEDSTSDVEAKDWNLNVIYVLDLVTRLHNEDLLCSDHYLDWALRRLETSDTQPTLIPLLVIQNLGRPSSESAGFGQRLASACVLQLHKLSPYKDDGPFRHLYYELEGFVKGLMLSNPEQFVVPQLWQTVREMLVQMRKAATTQSSFDSLQHIILTNDRLAQWVDGNGFHNSPEAIVVVRELDAALPRLSFESLASTLRTVVADPVHLSTILIVWTCSKFRSGQHRIWLACRLIRHWHQEGHLPAHQVISTALSIVRDQSAVYTTTLARFCAEMVRSGHFDAGTYLQSLGNPTNRGKSGNDLELALQLPVQNMSPHQIDLRNELLTHRGHAASPSEDLLGLKKAVPACLKAVFADAEPETPASDILHRVKQLTAPATFELSKWLRAALMPLLVRKSGSSDVPLSLRATSLIVSLADAVYDYVNLQDVVVAMALRCDQDGLHLIATSAEARDEAIIALGFQAKLWHAMFSKYRSLRPNNPPHKELCGFFLRTTHWYRRTPALEQFLRREVDFCESTFAACTPLSDLQVESSEEGRSEVDLILANGPSLDTAQLSTALEKMLSYISLQGKLSESQIDSVVGNLKALKSANEDHFVPYLRASFFARLPRLDQLATARLIPMLLQSESLSLAQLLDVTQPHDADEGATLSPVTRPLAALNILQFLFTEVLPQIDGDTNDQLPSDLQNSLHRHLWRQQSERELLLYLISLLADCLELDSSNPRHADLQMLLRSPPFVAMMQRLFAHKAEQVYEKMEAALASDSATRLQNVQSLVLSIADPGDELRARVGDHGLYTSSHFDLQRRIDLIRHLFSTVDACSLSCFQLALLWATHVPETDNDTSAALANACLKLAAEASWRHCPLWQTLILKVSTPVANHLQRLSQQALLFKPKDLEAFTRAFRSAWSVPPSVLVAIIAAARRRLPKGSQNETGELIARHLQGAIETGEEGLLPASQDFTSWLKALLSLSLVYHDSFIDATALNDVLYVLSRIILFEGLEKHETTQYAFDVGCFFAPRASTRSLEDLQSSLEPHLADPRIRHILGISSSITDTQHPFSPLPPSSSLSCPTDAFVDASASLMKRWDSLLDPPLTIGLNDPKVRSDLLDAYIANIRSDSGQN